MMILTPGWPASKRFGDFAPVTSHSLPSETLHAQIRQHERSTDMVSAAVASSQA